MQKKIGLFVYFNRKKDEKYQKVVAYPFFHNTYITTQQQ